MSLTRINRPLLTMSLDGGPPLLIVDATFLPPPVEYIRSEHAMMPDPKWSFQDGNGHVHRWARTGREALGKPDAMPTLTASMEHHECDGSCGNWDCEGYDIKVWHCATCGDQVEPGYVPDYQARTAGIPIVTGTATATATVATEDGPEDRWGSGLDVVISGHGEDLTGRAYPRSVKHWSGGPPQVTFDVVLNP